MNHADDAGTRRSRHRLRGFASHLIGYFAVAAMLMVLNLVATPGEQWFVVPVIGWGAVLAIHAAYVMGFLDVFKKK